MISQQILDYVKNQLQSGFTVEQVRNALRQQGWMDNEISEIISKSRPPLQPQIKPENIQKTQKEHKSILLGLGNILTGLVFLIVGVLILIDIENFILSVVNTYISTIPLDIGKIMIWFITLLMVIAGIANLYSGVKLMKHEE
ncbi:MAG: hypothetical protein ABIH52_02685 [Candidatus Aenigmatarchaeota archaeon]|nr:hypothetical protein [Nanoarchaeota archaeon]